MYGFIHCALEDLLITKFGRETWERVLMKSGIRLRGGSFLIHKVYSDELTLKLVKATSDVLGLDIDTCLEEFGKHFLAFCQQNGYEKILRVLGSNLQDFLTNLDNLHDHLASTYPGMRAPSFRTTTGPDGSLHLHYYSERPGLHAIVRGLVTVIAKEFFDVQVTIDTLETGVRGQRTAVVLRIQQDVENIPLPVKGAPRFASKSATEGLSNEPKDLPIDVRTFCSAFPFHVIFRRDFVITQVGKSLFRLTRLIWKSKNREHTFTDLFEVCRPVIDCTFDAITDHQNMVFVIRTKDGVICGSNHLRLKGQMVSVPESDSLLFLCSPRVRDLNEMDESGVYFSDFPIHDRGRDLILLGHHRRGERELVEKLDEASNHLKILDKKLRDDKKKTEELLQSIFPGHIAQRLCQSLPVEAERFDMVTCLFSDIVGFTAMCSTVPPIDIVRLLNRLYLQFDNLTSLHDVYKVETIGDAYVVVAGVPKFVPNHADRIIAMAVAMVEVTRYVTSPVEGLSIEIRVGVHSGSVVAGVLGVKMPRYCLLGNTVTLANQLESKSKPGRVTISLETKRCLTLDVYEFEDNPSTRELLVPGCFVTRIHREGDTADMSALTVTSGAGSMFRSPTNSPGHSDGTTNDSNSPSLQSPSPHLTFKGIVCIPHVDVTAHLDIRSPNTGSPSYRGSAVDKGSVFVFPPSPIPLSLTRKSSSESSKSLKRKTPPVCSFGKALLASEQQNMLSRIADPAFQNGDGSLSIQVGNLIDSFVEFSRPTLVPLQPVPRRGVRGWTRTILRNRRWSSRKLAPAENPVNPEKCDLNDSSRHGFSLRGLLPCVTSQRNRRAATNAPSREESFQKTSGRPKRKLAWKFSSKQTNTVIAKVRLSSVSF